MSSPRLNDVKLPAVIVWSACSKGKPAENQGCSIGDQIWWIIFSLEEGNWMELSAPGQLLQLVKP